MGQFGPAAESFTSQQFTFSAPLRNRILGRIDGAGSAPRWKTAMNTSIRALSLTLWNLVEQRLRTDLHLRSFFDSALGGTMVTTLLAPEELMDSGRRRRVDVALPHRTRRADPESAASVVT